MLGAGSVFIIYIIYAFTNKRSSPCNLYGYPGFVLLNSQNQPLKGVKVIRTPIPQQQSPGNITLAPMSKPHLRLLTTILEMLVRPVQRL
ncbi:DUF4232 domain-containing protein [Nostoc commune]|uniref:DUF4232 domain-containing protein n=1 Tax=Nostoc commune TaxID=1178 RepID=UPI003969BF81